MSTAVPLPLDTLTHDEFAGAQHLPYGTHGQEAQALRQAVTERLEQHRRRRNPAHSDVQHALPGMDRGANAGWTTGKPNRIADSVAARFAKSQSYREFLQQEAEVATRQAEAAADVARRNADAVAAAQQQLMEEMREWEMRQYAPASTVLEQPAAEAANAEPGVLLPMQTVAEPATEFSVLAPSEALRESPAPAAAIEATPAPAKRSKPAETMAAAAQTPAPAAPAMEAAVAAPVRIALPAADPSEPTTPIPANLIEFPRQLVAARKARPRLAEGPLREEADAQPERAQLRIFEVEASSFSTTPAIEPASSLPEWSSIRLDSWTAPHETAQPDAQVSLTLPVYAAPLERRVMAATVDACCVGTAFLLAVAAAGLAGGTLPTGLFAAGASAVTLLLFGIGYLLLSFTLSGHTVGMRYARIALCTFGDDNPTRSEMRRRLLATALSAGSLGLGFAWAMLDDDKLGWHDRISRMYQRAY